jgi:hypothetical protein
MRVRIRIRTLITLILIIVVQVGGIHRTVQGQLGAGNAPSFATLAGEFTMNVTS